MEGPLDAIRNGVWTFCCDAGFSLSPLFWLPVALLTLLFWLSLGRGQGLRAFLNSDGALSHPSTRAALLAAGGPADAAVLA